MSSEAKRAKATKLPLAVEKLAARTRPEFTQVEIAAMFNVTPQVVWSWLHGRSKPDLPTMLAMKKKLDIPIEEWVLEDKVRGIR